MNLQSAQDIEKSAIKKLTWHIVPLMILLYFLAFLDRNNMAYAAMALEDSLGLTATAFGFASGIFFIGYFMFEIPSNAGTIKFGPRLWFARILITGNICHFDGVRQNADRTLYLSFYARRVRSRFLPFSGVLLHDLFRQPGGPKFSACSLLSSRYPTPWVHRFQA